jgi:hypothetical protein
MVSTRVDDVPGEHVDDEGHVGEALPGRDACEVRCHSSFGGPARNRRIRPQSEAHTFCFHRPAKALRMRLPIAVSASSACHNSPSSADGARNERAPGAHYPKSKRRAQQRRAH